MASPLAHLGTQAAVHSAELKLQASALIIILLGGGDGSYLPIFYAIDDLYMIYKYIYIDYLFYNLFIIYWLSIGGGSTLLILMGAIDGGD